MLSNMFRTRKVYFLSKGLGFHLNGNYTAVFITILSSLTYYSLRPCRANIHTSAYVYVTLNFLAWCSHTLFLLFTLIYYELLGILHFM